MLWRSAPWASAAGAGGFNGCCHGQVSKELERLAGAMWALFMPVGRALLVVAGQTGLVRSLGFLV
jgi:hypothetical protein